MEYEHVCLHLHCNLLTTDSHWLPPLLRSPSPENHHPTENFFKSNLWDKMSGCVLCMSFSTSSASLILWKMIEITLFCGQRVPHCVSTRLSFFFCSSTDGCLGCFHIVPYGSSLAVNMGMHMSLWRTDYISLVQTYSHHWDWSIIRELYF